MRQIAKSDYQGFLRSIPWQVHLVLDEQVLKRISDNAALELARKLGFHLCKMNLHSKFSTFALKERFHWVAIFQGTRDAGNRHLHIMIYFPPKLWRGSVARRLRIMSAVQRAWLKARRSVGKAKMPIWIWQRVISGDEDSASVATYVSRFITPGDWNIGNVYFSQ